MKVVIAGAGAVGTFIARTLHERGHDVLLLERDAAHAARVAKMLDVQVVAADACEVSALRRNGLELADVVVAATGDDEDNLVVSLVVKQEFAVPRVVARVNNPRNHWQFNENWGVDVAVSTPMLLTSLVEEAVSVGSLVRLFNLEGGARLVEMTLAPSSPVCGSLLGSIAMPPEVSIAAIVRDGHVVVPRSDSVLAPGDEVLALVSDGDAELALSSLLTGRDDRAPS